MDTFFLKFQDKETAIRAFKDIGIKAVEGEIPCVGFMGEERIDISVLHGSGTIWTKTGRIIKDTITRTYKHPDTGEEITESRDVESEEMIPIEGFHVNVSLVPEGLKAYEIPAPNFPKAKFCA